jgi:transcriptional regulator with XRE-family HTH domain
MNDVINIQSYYRKRGEGPTVVDLHVGQRLYALRREKNLTQQELSAAIGVTFQQLQKYESGKNRISASRLFFIAHILGVEVNYFFGGFGDDSAPEFEVSGKKSSTLLRKIKALTNAQREMIELAVDAQLTIKEAANAK